VAWRGAVCHGGVGYGEAWRGKVFSKKGRLTSALFYFQKIEKNSMNVAPHQPSFFTNHLLPHIASILTGICTSTIFVVGMIISYSSQAQHSKDVQATQGQQIEDTQAQVKSLQIQVNKDDVLLAVIEQFKGETTKKLDRIEGLLLQDIHASKAQLQH
jgi:hypothetical protein